MWEKILIIEFCVVDVRMFTLEILIFRCFLMKFFFCVFFCVCVLSVTSHAVKVGGWEKYRFSKERLNGSWVRQSQELG